MSKFCNKTKRSVSDLGYHIKVNHTNEPVSCHLCNYNFKNVFHLKKHYKCKHSVTDSATLKEFIQLVAPEYASKDKRLKINRPDADNAAPGETERSEVLKKDREELVRKWTIENDVKVGLVGTKVKGTFGNSTGDGDMEVVVHSNDKVNNIIKEELNDESGISNEIVYKCPECGKMFQ